jgi:putative ABC transport system permease protein
MKWLDAVRVRLSLLFGRRAVESRMDEEFRFHLDMETERLVREKGLDPAEARRLARVAFGGVDRHKETLRDGRGLAWLDGFALDFKLGLRMLRKHLALSVIGGFGMAVAVAIGAAFFVFMTFYYSDPPVEDGDRVVTVDYIDGEDYRSTLFDYQSWKNELESVEDLAAYRTVNRSLESRIFGSGPAEVAEMTASAFRVARIPPLLGRPLLDSDEVEGAPPVIVIGYREWRERFAADPAVIGSEVRLDGIAYTVVGVMPENFRLPVNHGFWTAMVTGTPLGPAEGPAIHVFGRLAPGVEAAAAEAEAAVIGERMIAEYPQIYERFGAVVRPYVRHVLDLQQYPPWMIWLSQLFGCLVLTVVAVNVAVLFYARAARRRTEITVRSALGATRSRIVTQLFLEALALSTVAAVLGLLIARLGLGLLSLAADFRDDLPYWLYGGLPFATILYAVGLAALAAFVVGVLPALQVTGRDLQATLREIGGGTGPRIGTTWTVLICVQVAVAVGVLPAVVGIAWNYAGELTPTFPASEILSFSLPQSPLPGAAGSGQPGPHADHVGLQAELLRRVEAIPEVSAVTFASGYSLVRIELEDLETAAEPNSSAIRSNRVDVEYFGAFGVSLLAGRTFGRDDAVEGATAAIVNRAFVDRYLAGGDALGRRFREVPVAGSEVSTSEPWFEVVGVVEDMLRPSRGRSSPQTYHATALATGPLNLAARTRGIGAMAIVPRVREIAAEIAPGLNLSAFPMDESYETEPAELGFLLLLVGLVTLSVLLLSAGGISAMMSLAVTQRRREIGIRTALGASRHEIVTSIFSRSTRQLGIGLLIGTAGAALLDRLAGGELLRGEVVPLLTFVAIIMLFSGLLATVGPTRRALQIQPMEALREE